MQMTMERRSTEWLARGDAVRFMSDVAMRQQG